MAKARKELLISYEMVVSKIYYIRGYKVMLDQDLAALYGVETKRLKEAVRRNRARFPKDLMFELNRRETENLRSQIASSSWGGSRYVPMAFTEHGVLMLSSVLNSERAIKVNIQIMRVYTKMRELLLTNKEILVKLEQLERKVMSHDEDIQAIFGQLKEFLIPPEQANRTRIGFRRPGEEN